MTFAEYAQIAANSDLPLWANLQIPADIAEEIDAANWKAGTGLFDASGRREIFRAKRAQMQARGSNGGKQARIALCLEFAAEMRRHAATKSKASAAYYSAMRNARVFLFKAVALRAGARA